MRHSTLLIAAMFIAFIATAQMAVPAKSINYEAASWKTWLLDDPQKAAIPAPPTSAQSKVELQSLKQAMSKADKKSVSEIIYWNAGAPAYRWNQIVEQLVSLKPDVQLRMPASWMNIAIYDATILAWEEKIKYKRQRPNVLD
ncbi:MAG TPA: hypothetical protein VLJ41_01490, partial [Segetibacter sp.]|nr:hypothetical protein [Segetibacter sp.]